MPRIRPFFLPLLALPVIALMLWFMPPAANASGYPPFPAQTQWFNVSKPLTGAQLQGRVVLLDFFTPGCINCIHMIPIQQQLKQKFGDDLLVVGVTSPKFTASQQADNMTPFLRRYHVDEPVFIDANMTWWKHYGVFAWPTMLLLNPEGKVIHSFVGERSYTDMAAVIQSAVDSARAAKTLTHPKLPLKPLSADNHFMVLPTKIAVNDQRVAISDTGHDQIRIFDHEGKLLASIGDGKAGFADGSFATAEFNRPQGIAWLGDDLYVADTDNQRIRRIDFASQTVSTVVGNGQRVFLNEVTTSAKDTPLNSPWGLEAVDGDLFIAMAGDHAVWRYDPKTRKLEVYAGTGDEGLHDGERLLAQFAQSSGLAYHDHNLYVADPESSSIRQINMQTSLTMTLVGKGLFSFGDRDGAADQAQLQHPQGLAYLNGALYIADTFNNAIRKLDLDTLQVSTVAKNLAQPNGLAVLNDHTLLIADTYHDRIVALNLDNGKITDWPPTPK
ncbi:redoxin family protein [Halothiobacillus sp. 15-55-196]|jgi:sugar lactone lactonase YvrE/thiol-disulfide isomerase/thioredoxin|uniref:redoxin family protein n=1 Tax=Halothiobacillus sp. 15-55-196 TaxID=1970382 RepID=UPI0025BED536|nr:redoxin family protein [Halothiobacillus sp. 15-55-196]